MRVQTQLEQILTFLLKLISAGSRVVSGKAFIGHTRDGKALSPTVTKGFLHTQQFTGQHFPFFKCMENRTGLQKGGIMHEARSTYPYPQKAFVMPYQPHICYGEIFQDRTYIHIKTIPGGNTRKLPIFQENLFSILLHFLEGKQIYRTVL